MFKREDLADYFVLQHLEIKGKLLSFIRKAKDILNVVIKGVHLKMSIDLLRSALAPYT